MINAIIEGLKAARKSKKKEMVFEHNGGKHLVKKSDMDKLNNFRKYPKTPAESFPIVGSITLEDLEKTLNKEGQETGDLKWIGPEVEWVPNPEGRMMKTKLPEGRTMYMMACDPFDK